jgi:DNA-binding transcriptional MerR regulator
MHDPAAERSSGPDAATDPAAETAERRTGKRASAFRTIGEVADDLDLPTHVLRFWESKFPQLKPLKRGGGRRYYRPEDIDLLRHIRRCLYQDGYTIRGVQKLLREGGRGAPEPVSLPVSLPLPVEDAAPSLFPLDPLPPPAGAEAASRKPRHRGPAAETLEELRRDLLAARALLVELQKSRDRS